jgi:thioredoxin 1
MIQTKNPQEITDQNFKELVLDSNIPVLVDFWAEWCVPCQMITPIVKEIASLFNKKILVCKLNVNENPLISSKFSIEAIPTLILFDKKNIIKRFMGVQSKDILIQTINSILKK